MDHNSARSLQTFLNQLQQSSLRLSHIITYVLTQYNDPNNPLLRDLIDSATSIVASLYYFNTTSKARISEWAHNIKCSHYTAEIRLLAREESWHFRATHTHPDQIRDFQLEAMVTRMFEVAPEVCDLLRHLLGTSDVPADEEVPAEVVSDSEDDLWEALGVDVGRSSGGTAGKQKGRKVLRGAFVRIKTAVILCMAMQSIDAGCNAFQSVMGVFLHACNTPDKVIKVLSRLGISISLSTIRYAIKSLSKCTYLDIERLGRTLLTSYAFDNFDVLLKTLIATVDGRDERGLLHMTSGTLLGLEHGVTLEHLKCSKLLWNRSELNLQATDPRPFDPLATMEYLYTLHPEPEPVDDDDLGRQGRYRSWVFIQTLLSYGPAYFTRFAQYLPDPEPIEAIPVTKLHQVPLRAMDISQSTVGGNIDAIHNMYSQAGVGKPTDRSENTGEPFVDLEEFVTIIHGDLSTYERVTSALRRRSVERTSYNHLNSVVFVMGLFHFKMAAADAIWRLLVAPNNARTDETSFMKIAGRLRPKESSRLVSGAKFRQQHELIQHVGAVLRLDAWRVEVRKRTKKSLEEWADSEPSLSDVQEIADSLTSNYVEGEGLDLYDFTHRPSQQRDVIRENTTRTHNYLLLYEELCYAMNEGDIGRFETLLPSWIHIFLACGKHKYSTKTLQFMHAVHFIYPEGLKRAIRYNILVNPSGKPHAFRAVDWVVELLNLFIKAVYGGEGSNRTKDLILLESALVLLYRSSHENMERNLKIAGFTTHHAAKDMRATILAVLDDILCTKNNTGGDVRDTISISPNDYKAKRTAAFEIKNAISIGTETLQAEAEKMKKRNRAPPAGVVGVVSEGSALVPEHRDERGEVVQEEEEEEPEEEEEELSMDDLSIDGL